MIKLFPISLAAFQNKAQTYLKLNDNNTHKSTIQNLHCLASNQKLPGMQSHYNP